jgi:hypothetical protein
MEDVFDYSLGYTNCNICGDGENRVTISIDPESMTYDYYRESPCFKQVHESGISQERMLEMLQRDDFLVSTRRARARVKKFKLDVAEGRIAERFVGHTVYAGATVTFRNSTATPVTPRDLGPATFAVGEGDFIQVARPRANGLTIVDEVQGIDFTDFTEVQSPRTTNIYGESIMEVRTVSGVNLPTLGPVTFSWPSPLDEDFPF